MKTSELEPPLLDFWVAKVEDHNPEIIHGTRCREAFPGGQWYEYSTKWSKGGPIMDREYIGVEYCPQVDSDHPWIGWLGSSDDFPPDQRFYPSNTALIAAMRAYVASKCGEEVPDGAC